MEKFSAPHAFPLVKRIALGLFLLVGGSCLYYFASQRLPSSRSTCRAPAQYLAPFAKGPMAALSIVQAPHSLSHISFLGPNDQPVSLKDFSGKAILLNIWASWCVPCRKEMPDLDRVQEKLSGEDFTVLTINIDTTQLEKRAQFWVETKIQHLTLYHDAQANLFRTLRATTPVLGLPTSLLIDKNGCHTASLAGPAPWDSPEAYDLLREFKAHL